MYRPQTQCRRDILKAGAMIVGTAMVGGLTPCTKLMAVEAMPTTPKLRLLILGGTGFIGPWMIKTALSRGHHVTLFNRGRSENPRRSPDGTETLYGNRDPDLHAQTKIVDGEEVDDEASPKSLDQLRGKKWDAVIDNSGYVPRIVQASAELLAPNVGQYLFISTVSAYASSSRPGADETDTLATMDDPTNEDVQMHYGALKAHCELAAEKALPGRVTFLRPGYIAGPGDPTDRFTYWPVRTKRGGEVLVPGNPDDPVQFIDVRDLAEFTIRCVEHRILGVFNATGPEQKLTVAELMSACVAASEATGKKSGATFTYIPYDWLARNSVPIGTMPILLPSEGATAGFHLRSVSKAVGAGISFHGVADTCRALVDGWPAVIKQRTRVTKARNDERATQGLSTQLEADHLVAGISPAEEAKLLADWHATREEK